MVEEVGADSGALVQEAQLEGVVAINAVLVLVDKVHLEVRKLLPSSLEAFFGNQMGERE